MVKRTAIVERLCTVGTVWRLALYIAMLLAYMHVEVEASLVYTKDGCNECLNRGDIMCRSRYNNSVGHCCESNDPFSINCTSSETNIMYDVCSGEIPDAWAEQFVCPFRWEECNKENPVVELRAATHVENEVVFLSAAGWIFA